MPILSSCLFVSGNAPDAQNQTLTESDQAQPAAEPTDTKTEETPFADLQPAPPPKAAPDPVPIPQIELELADTQSTTPDRNLADTQAAIEAAALAQARALQTLCAEIGGKLASVGSGDCFQQQLVATDGTSVLGRPLALKEYDPLPDREPLGRILLIGGIHGDEYSSVSIVFKWMSILNEHHSGLFHWQVIPLANPDGLLREESQRQNENGVDLNRNFPSSDWDELALEYWVERTSSNARRFPGNGPASEPEVAWLVEHIESFRPDIIISVHAPFHLVDYDGPPQAPEQLGDLYLSKLGVYPGSLGNYARLGLDIPVVTIELPYAGIMPSDEHISRMWTDLVAWLVKQRGEEG